MCFDPGSCHPIVEPLPILITYLPILASCRPSLQARDDRIGRRRGPGSRSKHRKTQQLVVLRRQVVSVQRSDGAVWLRRAAPCREGVGGDPDLIACVRPLTEARREVRCHELPPLRLGDQGQAPLLPELWWRATAGRGEPDVPALWRAGSREGVGVPGVRGIAQRHACAGLAGAGCAAGPSGALPREASRAAAGAPRAQSRCAAGKSDRGQAAHSSAGRPSCC